MKMPLMLELENKKILVVGGGTIGLRKCQTLLSYNADIVCVSLNFVTGFEDIDVTCITSSYESSFIQHHDIIIAATDQVGINKQVYEDSHLLNKLCMTVDHINPSDFSFMAVKEKDGLLIGVSTNGGSPIFSKQLAKQLIDSVPKEEFEALEKMIKERNLRLNIDKN